MPLALATGMLFERLFEKPRPAHTRALPTYVPAKAPPRPRQDKAAEEAPAYGAVSATGHLPDIYGWGKD
jgi:hypothetical protein